MLVIGCAGRDWSYDGVAEQRLRRKIRSLHEHVVEDPKSRSVVLVVGVRSRRRYNRKALELLGRWLDEERQFEMFGHELRNAVFDLLGW